MRTHYGNSKKETKIEALRYIVEVIAFGIDIVE